VSTARRTWQLVESRIAAFFGCRRAVLSGSSGRDDQTCADTTHEILFIECKLREQHSARTLHDATRELSRREKKIPVLCLADKGRPGFLICVHSTDWEEVIAEYAAGLTDEGLEELTGLIRRAYDRRRGLRGRPA
jgi:hypothetical protein